MGVEGRSNRSRIVIVVTTALEAAHWDDGETTPQRRFVKEGNRSTVRRVWLDVWFNYRFDKLHPKTYFVVRKRLHEPASTATQTATECIYGEHRNAIDKEMSELSSSYVG